jgi:hypothetical protein
MGIELNRKHKQVQNYWIFRRHFMSSAPDSLFKPPPIVKCISRNNCLGVGKKIHVPDLVCPDCLQRHDPQQLRIWAKNNTSVISLINEEASRKQISKRNLEARGRYFCAFEDPDFQHCRWRLLDLNLRGTRLNCSTVRRKGTACSKCWRRHLRKIGIVQYFTPTGLCHQEADRIVTGSVTLEEKDEEDEDDVEGYNVVLS